MVDELAHTNVPGSRNEKRWQDVDELLAAGIDVISTVNIQHFESLNDVVERITGVAQRETVPDEVVRRADQQELVDMTPYALRRRMAHGNIYPSEKIDAALSNYFREGNLGALRELALLWMADRVDESLQDYMKDRGIEGPWEARERILVGISGRPEDEALVRRAARMAARRGGDLLGVHVVLDDAPADPPALDEHRTLVLTLGGSFREVVGRSVPEALLEVARAENVTQIVIGASTRSRWRELVHGSVVNRVARDVGPDRRTRDLAGSATPAREALDHGPAGRSRPVPAAGGVGSWRVVLLPLLTVVLVVSSVIGSGCRARSSSTSPPSSRSRRSVGSWPAIVAAIAASLAINWYFTHPIHTWTIAEPENLLAILVFVVVAVVVSVLVDRAARLRTESQRARTEAETLARQAGWLMAEEDPIPSLLDHLRTSFGLEAVSVLRPDGDGGWQLEASSGSPAPSRPEDGTDSLSLRDDAMLVLRGAGLPAESRRVLTAFAAQLAVAVRGRELAAEVAEAATVAEVSDLRAAILAAVSHDLRTPLASIKASVSSLRQDDVAWTDDEVAEFLATIEEETDRLDGLVGNLLDMSRIQTGSLTLVRRRVGLDEVVPKALAGLPDHGRSIDVDVPEDLPRVDVDAALLERAIANVAGNAMAWSPPDRAVRLCGSGAAGRVELRVVDRGPGIPPSERDRVFEPFQRLGDRSLGAGVGLGLAVAKGFVEAMGGELSIEDTPGGGLTMVMSFEEAP